MTQAWEMRLLAEAEKIVNDYLERKKEKKQKLLESIVKCERAKHITFVTNEGHFLYFTTEGTFNMGRTVSGVLPGHQVSQQKIERLAMEIKNSIHTCNPEQIMEWLEANVEEK